MKNSCRSEMIGSCFLFAVLEKQEGCAICTADAKTIHINRRTVRVKQGEGEQFIIGVERLAAMFTGFMVVPCFVCFQCAIAAKAALQLLITDRERSTGFGDELSGCVQFIIPSSTLLTNRRCAPLNVYSKFEYIKYCIK